MTWPFENDTSAIIKTLASAQLKKERLKKIFTIIAISLATFLMASVLLLSLIHISPLHLHRKFQSRDNL